MPYVIICHFMTYYDIWHMTYAQQNMALWVSKEPSRSVQWIYELKSICYPLIFLHKLQKKVIFAFFLCILR